VTLHVGQVLTIVNDDIDTHIAGPFLIGPGESTSYSFDEPKVITGASTLHPSEGFEIDVMP
jgi:hypothetical protein